MPAISFLPFLQAVPIATRILTLALVSFSLVGLFLSRLASENTQYPGVTASEVPWLVLVPGTSWKFPWVLLTAGWVELSILELMISAISLPLACRYLERIWGPTELVRFCIITIIGSNIIVFGFSWLMFILLGQEEALYGLPYHGLTALQVGFLVAFTQLIPEHQLQFLGRIKIRVKTLPGLYILASNVLVIVLGPSPYILIQFGFFVAWVYLRFFKLSEDGLSRGDRSETFAFQYWFPPPIRPVIAKGSNFVFNLSTRVGLVQHWDEPVQGGSYAMLPGPGGARAEAERRRALALKALDARLASTSPAPGSSSTPSSAAVSTVPVPAPPPSTSSTAPPSAPPLKSSGSSKAIPTTSGDESKEAKD